MSMNSVPERLAALRAAMKANGVDVYLIPVGDPHASEYLPEHYTSLTYFSGFHGENSNFVVTMTESAVWADGRYFVQAPRSSSRRWASRACPPWKNIAPRSCPRAASWACVA